MHGPSPRTRLVHEVGLRLPEPTLARSGPLPHGRGWSFESKLDGFRCLVCTHGSVRQPSQTLRGGTGRLSAGCCASQSASCTRQTIFQPSAPRSSSSE